MLGGGGGGVGHEEVSKHEPAIIGERLQRPPVCPTFSRHLEDWEHVHVDDNAVPQLQEGI